MTRSDIRDDIYLRVKTKPSEDDNVYGRHIDAIIDRYRAFFIKKEISETGSSYLDPSIISYFANQISTPLAQEDCYKGYKVYTYTLPASVVDLPGDMGIYNVSTTTGKRFKRIDKRDIDRFLRIPQATIDCTYHRLGNTLYLIKKSDLAKTAPKFDIDIVIGDTIGSGDSYVISDSAEYPVSDSMAAAIIEAVVQQLKMSEQQPVDYISDGAE